MTPEAWQHLSSQPASDNKHAYWIAKIVRKIKSASKVVNDQSQEMHKKIQAEHIVKDDKGELVKSPDGKSLEIKPESKPIVQKMLEDFNEELVDITADPLPLHYFAHMKFAPADMEFFEPIIDWEPKESLKAV